MGVTIGGYNLDFFFVMRDLEKPRRDIDKKTK
jgi:hypothetical protein